MSVGSLLRGFIQLDSKGVNSLNQLHDPVGKASSLNVVGNFKLLDRIVASDLRLSSPFIFLATE
jgi:hypothetical protein